MRPVDSNSHPWMLWSSTFQGCMSDDSRHQRLQTFLFVAGISSWARWRCGQRLGILEAFYPGIDTNSGKACKIVFSSAYTCSVQIMEPLYLFKHHHLGMALSFSEYLSFSNGTWMQFEGKLAETKGLCSKAFALSTSLILVWTMICSRLIFLAESDTLFQFGAHF